MTPEATEAEIIAFEEFFHMLPDVPSVFDEWRRLMNLWKVVGRQSFDARLIATMIVHKMPYLMTFDVKHFKRYEDRGIIIDGKPLRIFHPSEV